jgi:phenylalanyl-tRNA synthetase beta chain
LDISILPNMARNANIIGIARELAAMLGRELKKSSGQLSVTSKQLSVTSNQLSVTSNQSSVTSNQSSVVSGQSVKELVEIEIGDPELNPRFVVGLIRNIELKPSPYQIQRRLKLAGVRPINNVVDATNYAMLEFGEPLHAFDYDVLKERAGDKKIKFSTRTAKEGEKLTTLDGNTRTLTSMNVLVCDEKGPLSLAGVMGGSESEVYDASKEVLDAVGIETKPDEKLPHGKASVRGKSTVNILLEGAAWNFINIRRTAKQHNLPSEASFRFSRGVHPAMAEGGVMLGLKYMAEWAGGVIAPDLVDAYPLPPKDAVVEITVKDVKRWLGIDLTLDEISKLLSRLEFKCEVTEHALRTTSPTHRMDIGEGVVGVADVLEEVARSYGYDNIPTTSMADALPPQVGNPTHEWEEHLRDLLVALGLQEVVSYRMTSVEKESRIAQYDDYVRLANPIAPEKSVLRRSLIASVLDALEKNIRYNEAFSFFEIGSVFEPVKNDLPNEPRKLAIAMTGLREATAWDVKDSAKLDFFDLKGRIELMLSGLRLTGISYTASDSHSSLHPGKAAEVKVNGQVIGMFGELHPLVKEGYELGDSPVLVAEFDLDAMRAIAPTYGIKTIPETPPIYEDIAVIVDESVLAETVEALIRQTGGRSVTSVRLFDLYRDEKIGEGKKSLAYALTYQAEDKTMTDADAAAIRNKIVKRLEKETGAKLRS